jgi:hypothetical protein
MAIVKKLVREMSILQDVVGRIGSQKQKILKPELKVTA